MKSAVIDNEGMIWGTGIDDEAALKDAYKWLNQEHDYEDYAQFQESKTYDSLKLVSITDEASALCDKIGGDYADGGDHYKLLDGVIMTVTEYNKQYGEE